jgi:hypothetical protein
LEEVERLEREAEKAKAVPKMWFTEIISGTQDGYRPLLKKFPVLFLKQFRWPFRALPLSCARLEMEPPKKIDLLRAAMAAGDWRQALSIANRFPRLGEHKATITRAHNALQSPELYRQMGQDPVRLVAAGIVALREARRGVVDSISA